MAGDVFISHSTDDARLAKQACDALENGGVSCWIAPRDILPGETWSGSIVRAIEGSRMLLVVLSGHANASPEVLREVEQASRKGKRLVVLRIEKVEPSVDLAFFLTSTQWLDAFPPPLRPRLDRLVETAAYLLDLKAPLVDVPAPAPRPKLVEVDLDDFGRRRRPGFVARFLGGRE
jgi:TIR domain